MKQQWTTEQANEWYAKQPWIRGYNGYPSNCVNRIAMWQSFQHEEVFRQIESEFRLAKETGFNAVRAIIQFEVWYYEHDSFMNHLEEYFTLADRYGLRVMLTLGNDCTVPKALMAPIRFGEQHVDWGYHSGISRGPHSKYVEPGYMMADETQYLPEYYKMVDEIAAKYAKDSRLLIWDVWNEIGNGRRDGMSLPYMEKFFEIIRSHDPIQPLTADCWRYDPDTLEPLYASQKRALELSDVITFHCYANFQTMVRLIEKLKNDYKRPLICNEWLNRITHNNVDEIFPLLYLENVGSFHWGLIQGYSQTYEPWGIYNDDISNPDYYGPNDYTLYQHDLYRFNGRPYIAREIQIIKQFCALADRRFDEKKRPKETGDSMFRAMKGKK